MKPFNVFPYDSNIHFMRLRWVSLTIAALIMFVAMGAMVYKGFNFALDFTGGVGVELRFPKTADVDGIRSRLEAQGYSNAQVQTFGTGPVKGFAVSLIVGILTSMYTAVSVSRGIATLIYGPRRKLKSIAV